MTTSSKASQREPTIGFPFVGDSLGGSHISTLTLIEQLADQPVTARILVHESGPVSHLLEERGLSFERLTLPRYVGRDRRPAGHLAALLATAPKLSRYLQRAGIDVLHSNDARMHLTWGLPARLTGTPQVWHQRNVYAHSRLTDLMIRLPRSIVANSRFVAGQLPATVAGRVSVIENPFEAPPALDREACRRDLLAELGQDPNARVVGHFGNLIGWKRPLDFVRAAIALEERHKGPLVFAVFGEDREGLQAEMTALAAQAGVGSRLHFLGFRQPVWPWLGACDLVIAPSVGEPFGRVLVEAMLAGTAVVASDSGGHREIVEPEVDGLLFPPGEPEAAAQAAARLLGDAGVRQALTERAAGAARRRYDSGRIARETVAHYRHLLEGKTAQSSLREEPAG